MTVVRRSSSEHDGDGCDDHPRQGAPMDGRELMLDLFSRVDEHVGDVVEGLSVEQAATEPEDGSNSIAWELWHLARIQDAHVAEVLERDQVYVEGSWAGRFNRPDDPHDVGYGHSPADAASVRPSDVGDLLGYYEAVATRTRGMLDALDGEGLARIVDRNWDPPVTLGVRLISIADDNIQHAGQAAYVKGLLERR
jgi:uncharacterized damage-inducible protein DinB